MKKRQNLEAGFTLVEMIVVIAIMAILAGIAAGSMSLITAGNAKKSAARFNSALNETQVQTMSLKDPTYLYLYRASNGKVMVATAQAAPVTSASPAPVSSFQPPCEDKNDVDNVSKKKEREIGDKSITVKYKQGSTEKTLGDNEILRITFRKDSGAYDVEQSGITGGFSSTDFISEVNFEGKGHYKVKMVKETGKHYVER